MSEDITLGPCCCCGKDDTTVRNIYILAIRAPAPGMGWGCAVCGLPSDGAVAVLCDECCRLQRDPVYVCTGRPTEPGRLPLKNLVPIPFWHKIELHPEFTVPAPRGEKP